MCFTHAKTQLCCDAPSFLGSVGKVGSASKVPAASFVTTPCWPFPHCVVVWRNRSNRRRSHSKSRVCKPVRQTTESGKDAWDVSSGLITRGRDRIVGPAAVSASFFTVSGLLRGAALSSSKGSTWPAQGLTQQCSTGTWSEVGQTRV